MKGIESLASRFFICCIVVLAFTSTVAAQPDPVGLDGDGPWVVRVQTVDRDVVRGLAEWYDVWSVHPEKGFILVQVDRPAVTACSPTGSTWRWTRSARPGFRRS